MIEFAKNNKLIVLLVLIIMVMLAYHFLYPFKGNAAIVVYEHVSGVKWERGYLVARAGAIKKNKETFKYKGSEYNTSTGKKVA